MRRGCRCLKPGISLWMSARSWKARERLLLRSPMHPRTIFPGCGSTIPYAASWIMIWWKKQTYPETGLSSWMKWWRLLTKEHWISLRIPSRILLTWWKIFPSTGPPITTDWIRRQQLICLSVARLPWYRLCPPTWQPFPQMWETALNTALWQFPLLQRIPIKMPWENPLFSAVSPISFLP